MPDQAGKNSHPRLASRAVDLLTHTLLTRQLIGRRPSFILAGLGPDLPFYLTYPALVIAQGKLRQALGTGDWPEPPAWVKTLHHAFHSLPVALAGAGLIWLVSRRWPGRCLAAWLLHILVDLPTHSRRAWGPKFLWPLSDYVVAGVSWVELLLHLWRFGLTRHQGWGCFCFRGDKNRGVRLARR